MTIQPNERDSGMDDELLGQLREHFAEAQRKGLSRDAAGDLIANAVLTAAEQIAPKIAADVLRSAPEMVAKSRAERETTRDQVRARWGQQMDRYIVIRVVCEELCRDYRGKPNGTELDPLFDALALISASVLRISLEVFNLLENGYPGGALARCRTLHELSVCAWILADYGRRPGNEALGLRYLAHADARGWDKARTWQRSSEASPFDEAELARLRERQNQAVQVFGGAFKRDWGWAIPLFDSSDNCTFAGLERLAELSDLRGHYSYASTHVHGGTESVLLNLADEGSGEYMVIGPTLDGFAMPLDMGRYAMANTTAALLAGTATDGDPKPSVAVLLFALEALMDDGQGPVDDAAARKHDSVGR
jgi:hypothetical protein